MNAENAKRCQSVVGDYPITIDLNHLNQSLVNIYLILI